MTLYSQIETSSNKKAAVPGWIRLSLVALKTGGFFSEKIIVYVV